MKITDNRTGHTKRFCMLNVGDTFEYNNETHMKITHGETYNAINLSGAFTEYFEINEVVIPVNCELVIS